MVIGAGAAGLVSAYIAATVKARVTLVEANDMGGDCLNTGCVPSKALIQSARLAREMRGAKEAGIHTGSVEVEFAAVMDRVQRVVDDDRTARFDRALQRAGRGRAQGPCDDRLAVGSAHR